MTAVFALSNFVYFKKKRRKASYDMISILMNLIVIRIFDYSPNTIARATFIYYVKMHVDDKKANK